MWDYKDLKGGWVGIRPGPVSGTVRIKAHITGCHIPDDEIPNLISALQDYMSRRARETVAMDKLRAVREYREKWS